MNKFKLFSLLAVVSMVALMSSCSLLKGKGMEPLKATIKTTKGDIVVDLYGAETPLTCANFVNLANRGYFDGIVFHRVIDNFMAQVGDPLTLNPEMKNRWGTGGPGYNFEDEIVDTLTHDRPGVLSMANAGPGTNGSQIFITHVPTDWLNGKHAVFGKIGEQDEASLKVLMSIEQGDKIETVIISGDIPEQMKAMQPRVDEWNETLDGKTSKTIPQLKLKEAKPMK
jgi:peptidyl-prolyl cis-trans isomerase B (cyclophilin B)